ncbi:Myotubularin-related protein 6 [Thelohanellus kitauei]|uniref:Myotubularin-related protein 6 n=1 Tax=Thelohanellus kitauei TaxID=669202 RepID=A0A0C2MT48_THEKT|nr:Myotubularin-related protein 6 [Thelohanellus kitauei]
MKQDWNDRNTSPEKSLEDSFALMNKYASDADLDDFKKSDIFIYTLVSETMFQFKKDRQKDFFKICIGNSQLEHILRSIDLTANPFVFRRTRNDISDFIRCFINEALKICQGLLSGDSWVIEDNAHVRSSFAMCSLVKILLDSYYCTIEGFIYLIEKEWINYGFKNFKKENPHSDDKSLFIPYTLFKYVIMFLFYTHQRFFEFDHRFLDSTHEISFEDAANHKFVKFGTKELRRSESKNKLYDPQLSLFESHKDTLVFDNVGDVISSEICNENTLKEFWTRYQHDRTLDVSITGNMMEKIKLNDEHVTI